MNIRNHTQKALNVVNKINLETSWKLIPFLGPTGSAVAAYFLEGTTSLQEWSDLKDAGLDEEEIADIANWAEAQVRQQETKKLKAEERKLIARTTNRTRYLPVPILTYKQRYHTQTGAVRNQWRYDMSLASAGLLELVCETLYGTQEEPLSIQVFNALEKKEGKQDPIPSSEWNRYRRENIGISGERLGWNMNHPAWKLLEKTFPNGIDLSAYGHSLNAPTLPEGYFPRVAVQLQKLVDDDGRDLETDGSGQWNVDHPMFDAFITKHGICVWQIRGLQPQHGTFVKGIVRPVSLGETGPAFILDWNQVKGSMKARALEHRDNNKVFVQEGMHIGCMRVWNNKRSTLKVCFEFLENIKLCSETTAIVHQLIDREYAKLVKGGIDRLVAAVAADDQRIAHICRFTNHLNRLGIKVNPVQVPMIKKAVHAKLGRKLWHIAQGAGILLDQRVCILDANIKPGTIVAPGLPVGSTAGVFRLPMILAQGLRTLTVVEPSPHMLCRGKEVTNIVFMSPHDLTSCMQGDDDGDFIGITIDPLITELYKYLIDDRVYHIEPEGKKINYPTNSPEGQEHITYDQRGPVGATTNYRSALLAIGNDMAANAMSILIQESVDRAKRLPEWSDYRVAAGLQNWEQDEAGEYHFHTRLPEEELYNDELDMEKVKAWVHRQIIDAGCTRISKEGEIVAGDPCAWRRPGKRIDPARWVKTTTRSGWNGGNLVHECHDYAHERWFNQIEGELQLNAPAIELRYLLPLALAKNGLLVTMPNLTENEYLAGVREQSGLNKLSVQLKQAYAASDQIERDRKIDLAVETLQVNLFAANLTIEQIVTIWVMETSKTDARGVNDAFRVLAVPGNPVSVALGIDNKPQCQFLQLKQGSTTRLDRVIAGHLAQPDPQTSLINAIYKDTKHYEEQWDENAQGINLWECKQCMEVLTTRLVQKIRKNTKSKESQWIGQIVHRLNKVT